MSTWQFVAVVIHSIVCTAIIGLAMDLMRRRRNEGRPPDGAIWAYYLVLVGAFGYLAEPWAGSYPTFADLLFEAGVLMYLVGRAMERPEPSMVRRP